MSKNDPVIPVIKLQQDQIERASCMLRDTARLATTAPDPECIGEVAELAKSTMERLTKLQQNWMADWANWVDYAGTLAEADTIPKYVERSGNIVLRAQAQMVSQMTELSDLSDNLAVSYSFWASKRLGD